MITTANAPVKMTKVARHAANALAVAYAAYQEARRAEDALGVVVWGGMLIEAQRNIGITLAAEGNIRHFVNRSQAECDRIVAERAAAKLAA